MATVSKNRWILSIILGGILLVLAITGGSWKTTYAADVNDDTPPVIDYIYPVEVPAGSGDVKMLIAGEHFGTLQKAIRVWVQGSGHNSVIAPFSMMDTGIGVVIPHALLVSPTVYTIKVLKSSKNTVPDLPPTQWDLASNPVDFIVSQPDLIHLPLINIMASSVP